MSGIDHETRHTLTIKQHTHTKKDTHTMLHNITEREVTETRAIIIDSVNTRMTWEKARPEQRSLASKLDFLVTFRKRVERVDAFTLGFIHANPVDFEKIFLSHRRSSDAFNIYAMTKALEIAKCLNGSALTPTVGGDHMTLAGVMLAISKGIVLESFIAFEVNRFAQNECARGTYSSGATQTSSSLRALEAFGIVKKTHKVSNSQAWGIDDVSRYERMLAASNGISVATVTIAQVETAASESADSSTKSGRAATRKDGSARTVKRAAKAKVATATVDAATLIDGTADVASVSSVDIGNGEEVASF